MDKQTAISKLKKLRALIDEGEGGEKLNAQKLFDQLCHKYGISSDELDEQVIKDHAIIVSNDGFDQHLLIQIFNRRYRQEGYSIHTLVKKIPARDRRLLNEVYGVKNFNVLVKCPDATFVQLMFEFDVYLRSFNKSLKAFFYAFLDTNGLLLDADPNAPATSQEELERLREALRYSTFMEKTSIHKQLTN